MKENKPLEVQISKRFREKTETVLRLISLFRSVVTKKKLEIRNKGMISSFLGLSVKKIYSSVSYTINQTEDVITVMLYDYGEGNTFDSYIRFRLSQYDDIETVVERLKISLNLDDTIAERYKKLLDLNFDKLREKVIKTIVHFIVSNKEKIESYGFGECEIYKDNLKFERQILLLSDSKLLYNVNVYAGTYYIFSTDILNEKIITKFGVRIPIELLVDNLMESSYTKELKELLDAIEEPEGETIGKIIKKTLTDRLKNVF
jgi:hypothetical protein